MSADLEKLKEIGAQKIHEHTHITKQHVQALLHESFEDMEKIYFNGFIDILEREYDVKLDDLRKNGLKYFEEKVEEKKVDNQGFFVPSKEHKTRKFRYIILAIIIFLAAVYAITNLSSLKHSSIIDNSVIENAQKTIIENNDSDKAIIEMEENNETNINSVIENNATDEEIVETVEVKEDTKTVVDSEINIENNLTIIPHGKVWMGYIDIKTNQKRSKIFSGTFDVDTKKEWLFLFGHGNIEVSLNGKIIFHFNAYKFFCLFK
jgi:cytoskeletal protein RodZ